DLRRRRSFPTRRSSDLPVVLSPDLDEAREWGRRMTPKSLRPVYDGGEVGTVRGPVHTTVEFEYPVVVDGDETFLSLGVAYVTDQDLHVEFRPGDRLEVNGTLVTVADVDAEEPRPGGDGVVPFWSVVLRGDND